MNETTFHPKYILGWLVVGLIAGVTLQVTGNTNFGNLSVLQETASILVVVEIISCIFGCLGMLIDASNCNWKFSQITHPKWLWYIYPAFSFFIICLGALWAIFMSVFFPKK